MRIALYACLLCACLAAQTADTEFRVYTDHPRLFLTERRLRLLKRERERDSMRWRQFDLLVSGKARMPEAGFALGLYYAVTGDKAVGRLAVEAALGSETDLRQAALVYDWCQDLLTESQAKSLSAKLLKGLQARVTDRSIPAQRNRILAAIAVAERNPDLAESVLRDSIQRWWRGEAGRDLAAGRNLDLGQPLYATFEILHAVRDNLNEDLRDVAPSYFKTLPELEVAGIYPAPYAAAENDYRIPIYKGGGQPDMDVAAIVRAAGLATVAFDANALENQYLQGWLLQDRFLLRGAFGAPYEFLWANPYQPGLSYYHLPKIFHDPNSGNLILRSSWEEDAVWFAVFGGEMQLFQDGRIAVLDPKAAATERPKPVEIGAASVVLYHSGLRFPSQGEVVYVVGGKPKTNYDIEVDDEELRELRSDAAGAIELKISHETGAGVRMKESGNATR